MSEFFLAPALVKLRDEINAEFPKRDKGSDGWIGDSSHAARVSDHNPCWTCAGRYRGIVRAIDVDVDDNDPKRDLRREVLNATIGDPRVWYVISNGIIYSRTFGWAARKYTGSNSHFMHVHISLVHFAGEFDTRSWFEQTVKIQAIPVSLSGVRKQFLNAVNERPIEFNNGVGRIQRVLVNREGEELAVDGLVGDETLAAWARYERKHDGRGRRNVPDVESLAAFAKGRFRMVS
jgi:hypothetical protein